MVPIVAPRGAEHALGCNARRRRMDDRTTYVVEREV